MELLREEHGLLAGQALAEAQQWIELWRDRGFTLLTFCDEAYPRNLRDSRHPPPLLFVAGRLRPQDSRSVAVIGSRQATASGLSLAREVSGALAAEGFTVNSGLATGIDTAVHRSTLSYGGRTVAVIGTGLARSYPPGNAVLQRRICELGAVVSQFWPDAPPRRENFPLRNSVMAGISLATVVIQASARSGARLQARLSLEQGRPVVLMESQLDREWACELACHPNAHVVGDAAEVPTLIDRLSAGFFGA